jgi:hypothetical protein
VDTSEAVTNAYAWFEHNSGWAPPDAGTLAEWLADGVCRCPDECLVAPDAWCAHGLASWWLILRGLDGERGLGHLGLHTVVPKPDRLHPSRPDYRAVMGAHQRAVEAGEPGYLDPTTALFVLTGPELWARGKCCEQGCRHCPYP